MTVKKNGLLTYYDVMFLTTQLIFKMYKISFPYVNLEAETALISAKQTVEFLYPIGFGE